MAATIRRYGYCFLRRSFLRPLAHNYCSSSKDTPPDEKATEKLKDESSTDRPTETKRDLSDEKSETAARASHMTPGESALKGFARVLEKVKHEEEEAEIDLTEETPLEPDEPFATMLRKSKLMQIGNPAGRTILGTIVDTVGDDLYIDFGAKFHCVCPRPNYLPEKFRRGTRVKLQLKDLEMTSSFLGSEKHITLLEADAILIGLHRKPPELKL